MIDINTVRRSYGVQGDTMKKPPSHLEGESLSRLRPVEQGVGYSRRASGKHSLTFSVKQWFRLIKSNFMNLLRGRKPFLDISSQLPVERYSTRLTPHGGGLKYSDRTTLQHSSRLLAGRWLNFLRPYLGSMGNDHRRTLKNLPRLPAGQWLNFLRPNRGSMGNDHHRTLQNSPSRTKLPRFLVLPWWVVFVVLGATAIMSVSYSVGEEHEVTKETSHENQDVADHDEREDISEEATLIQQLQKRLEDIEEREQRLQQKQARVEGLQRDVEALAARQVKEAERLKTMVSDFEREKNAVPKEDPSLDHLVKVYGAMDPEEAALRIEKMEDHLALEILAGIKDKKAATVLAGVKPEKAAALSQGLRNFKKGNEK
ncbi:MAG: MotE family protein [Nitrospirales bacterium]